MRGPVARWRRWRWDRRRRKSALWVGLRDGKVGPVSLDEWKSRMRAAGLEAIDDGSAIPLRRDGEGSPT